MACYKPWASYTLPFQVVRSVRILGIWTTDGSTYGRTDLEPNHNKNFVVRERKNREISSDETNGFSLIFTSCCLQVYGKDSRTRCLTKLASTRKDLFMTVSAASANDDIQKKIHVMMVLSNHLISVVLPHVKTYREGVELLAKLWRKGAAEGNIITICRQYAETFGQPIQQIKSDDKYAVFLTPSWRNINVNDRKCHCFLADWGTVRCRNLQRSYTAFSYSPILYNCLWPANCSGLVCIKALNQCRCEIYIKYWTHALNQWQT